MNINKFTQKSMEAVNGLEKLAYESVHFFPDDTLTDQPERVIAAELIREKMLLLLDYLISQNYYNKLINIQLL